MGSGVVATLAGEAGCLESALLCVLPCHSPADGVTGTSRCVALMEPVGRLGGVGWELKTGAGL